MPRLIAWMIVAVLAGFLAWRDAGVGLVSGDSPLSAGASAAARARWIIARQDTGSPVQPPATRAEAETVRAAARAVLRGAPLHAPALRQAALASARLEGARPERAIRLAERVSRRDVPTQALLIQDAANAGDYAGVLRHLDTLLTLRPERVRDMAPALRLLVSLPEGREVLARYSRRPWFAPVLATVLDNSVNLDHLVALLSDPRLDVSRKPNSELLRWVFLRLVQAGDYRTAKALARGPARIPDSVLADFRITPRTSERAYVPLTWRLGADTGPGVMLTDAGTIEAEVPPDSLTVLLERAMDVAPGAYILTSSAQSLDGASPAVLSWSMFCLRGADRPLVWQQAIPPSATRGAARLAVTIPPDCPVQVWRLSAVSTGGQVPVSVRVRDIALRAGAR